MITCKKSFLMALTLITSTNIYAAISAITANSIMGEKPYILINGETPLTSLDELLTFQFDADLNDRTKPKTIISPDDNGDSITIPKDTKLSEILTIVTVNNTQVSLNDIEQLSVYDSDGDVFIDTDGKVTSTITGKISAKFEYEKSGLVITNLDKILSPCDGDVKLTLEITGDVLANTKYGNPNKSDKYEGNKKVTYQLTPEGYGLCYIQPKYSKINKEQNAKYPGGYNSDLWDFDGSINYGFNYQKLKAKNQIFPKTGFDKAQFALFGSENNGKTQYDYICSVSGGSWLGQSSSIDIYDNNGNAERLRANITTGDNCTFTINSTSRPTSKITITMRLKTGELVDTYNLDFTNKETSLWAEMGDYQRVNNNKDSLVNANSATFSEYKDARISFNNGATGGTPSLDGFYHAAYACGSDALEGKENIDKATSYFFSIKQLTNVPSADYESNVKLIPSIWNEYYSRDIGSFQPEWGKLSKYKGSPWPQDDNVNATQGELGSGTKDVIAVFTSSYGFNESNNALITMVHNNPQGSVISSNNYFNKTFVVCKK